MKGADYTRDCRFTQNKALLTACKCSQAKYGQALLTFACLEKRLESAQRTFLRWLSEVVYCTLLLNFLGKTRVG